MFSLSGALAPTLKKNSFHAQLSMKFQLLIKTVIPTNKGVSCFKPLRCIYHAKCWHFNIYEQDKFCAQLS